MRGRVGIDDLAFSFPSLVAAPGVYPWNPQRLERWALGEEHHEHDPEVTPDALYAVRFLLSVEDPSQDWRVGRFEATEAVAHWDAAHLEAFLAWTRDYWQQKRVREPWRQRARQWTQKRLAPPSRAPEHLDTVDAKHRYLLWWTGFGVLLAVGWALAFQGLASWKGLWTANQFPWLTWTVIVLAPVGYALWNLRQLQQPTATTTQPQPEQHFTHTIQPQPATQEAPTHVGNALDERFSRLVEAAGNALPDKATARVAAILQLPQLINAEIPHTHEHPYRQAGVGMLCAVLQEARAKADYYDPKNHSAEGLERYSYTLRWNLLNNLNQNTKKALVRIKQHLKDAELQHVELSQLNLQNANLRGANLQSSRLQSTNLQGADLQGANLRGADLQGADLRGANLKHVEFDEETSFASILTDDSTRGHQHLPLTDDPNNNKVVPISASKTNNREPTPPSP